MHKDFAEWYRSAGIEPDGEILPKRWGAINELSHNRDTVVSLTSLFYRLGKPSQDFLSEFVGEFQKTDPAFRTRDNDHELCVLAGATLIDVIESCESDLADMAALSLVCAAASNARPCPPVREIPEIAARYLGVRSASRASDNTKQFEMKSHRELFDALTAAGKPHDMLAKQLEHWMSQFAIVTEESNILWWLFSEYSRDEEQQWSKYSVPAVALMAGKELADLTRLIPGPSASIAFLDRVLRSARSKCPSLIEVKDAINDAPLSWRERYAANAPSELYNLAPFSYAVGLSVGTPDSNVWLPAFSQKSGIAPNAKMPPRLFAYQVYRECLLSRLWTDLK